MARHGRERVKVLKDANGAFLDPTSVNSTVRYSFETSLYSDGTTEFDGNISLSDCNRFINWSGDWDDQRVPLLRKVDAAIKMLREAQRVLVQHGIAADEFRAGVKKAKKRKARR